jgi:hypothetical protein
MGEMRNEYRILVGRDKSEHPGVNGRVKETNLRKIGLEGVDCVHLAQDRDW